MKKSEPSHLEPFALQILNQIRNQMLVSMRFFDLALYQLEYAPAEIKGIMTEGSCFYFSPKYILSRYKKNPQEASRDYLHLILHCIFYHSFPGEEMEAKLWDLACDITVENIITELNLKQFSGFIEFKQKPYIQKLKARVSPLTAEKIYHHLLENPFPKGELSEMAGLFYRDDHRLWYLPQETSQEKPSDQSPVERRKEIQDMWQDISERAKVNLETLSKKWSEQTGSLMQNLKEVNEERYDYGEFLRKFSVTGEDMRLNDEEFDYIYYYYGLHLYGNLPLIDPLEYKEVKKIKEFVIAIDTSGSVKGNLVQKFIEKTYNILMQQSNFFNKINIHIIQCDKNIKRDDKITSAEEFKEFIKDFQLQGFGGTDFRPVFDYVDTLIQSREFINMSGLIYFTDGQGIYPSHCPAYETAFVFLDKRPVEPPVPVWAMTLVLKSHDIFREGTQ